MEFGFDDLAVAVEQASGVDVLVVPDTFASVDVGVGVAVIQIVAGAYVAPVEQTGFGVAVMLEDNHNVPACRVLQHNWD